MRDRTPNLFLIGAPKCGTTSIAAYLDQHPAVFVPVIKELEYFADDGRARRISDRDEYLRMYRGAGNRHLWRLDASACYLYSPTAVRDIVREVPDARFLIILRDPIEMVPSLHHELHFTKLEDAATLDEAWAKIDRRKQGLDVPPGHPHPQGLFYDEVAKFGEQVRRVLGNARRENVHILLFDDIRSRPAKLYADLCAFLAIPMITPEQPPAKNAQKEWRHPWLANIALSKPVQMLKVALGVSRDSAVSRIFLSRSRGNGISAQMRAALADCYRSDVTLLESILGRKLDHWLRVQEDNTNSAARSRGLTNLMDRRRPT